MTENILNKFPLKQLHDEYGINWEQKENIKCYKHEGKFTIKGLVKEFNLNLYDLIFVCVVTPHPYTYDYFKGVVVLDKGLTTYSLLNSCNHYCNNKGTFEGLRKYENATAYVVVIDRKSLVEPKKHEWSLWNLTRFVADINTRFIYKPSKDELFHNGYRYRTWNERRSIEDALDKSGYSVIAKRRELDTKLEVMHQNNLEKVINTAFNKDNSDVFTKLLQVKSELAEQVKQASTSEKLREVCKSLDEIESLMRKYEEHIEYLQNAKNPEISKYYKYNSIHEVKDNLNKMNIRLKNIGVATVL